MHLSGFLMDRSGVKPQVKAAPWVQMAPCSLEPPPAKLAYTCYHLSQPSY